MNLPAPQPLGLDSAPLLVEEVAAGTAAVAAMGAGARGGAQAAVEAAAAAEGSMGRRQR